MKGIKCTQEEFIRRAKEKHGEKFDYSEVVYKTINSKVKIICPVHGIFETTPYIHLKCDCKKCYGNHNLSTEEYILKANLVHNFRYRYSKTVYISRRDKKKIIVTCEQHGDFLIDCNHHLQRKKGCLHCEDNLSQGSQIKFLERMRKIHGDKYDTSKVIFISSNIKVTIICHKHGEFKATPHSLITEKTGCPKCKQPFGETMIYNILDRKGILFQQQYRDKTCRDKNVLSFDFFLPNHNIMIERQGIQHYQFYPPKGKRSFHSNWNDFESTIRRDSIKRDWCTKNGYKLLVIPFWYNTYEDIVWFIENNISL